MAERKLIATKEDWDNCPMPSKTDTFIYKRRFNKTEIENLKYGHIPEEMEDKWFAYFEDNELHIFRSWTGNCIYTVKFNFFLNRHKVTVNRDENQYNCNDIDEDRETLEELINCWV